MTPPPAAALPTTPSAPRYRTTRTYTSRLDKPAYIAAKYAPLLTTSVLDVGCDRRGLAGHLPAGVRYVGVDFSAEADIRVNLDTHDLPFDDRSFATTVCTDVLEHLERLHAVFDELCRVSESAVIISLPNPARDALAALLEDRPAIKHYGLPLDPPADRHRWFFGAAEAEHFLRERARRCGFAVEQLDHEPADLPAVLGPGGLDLRSRPALNGGTLWCVLRRG